MSAVSMLANSGTPLMWLQAGHLIFGNLIIGIAEGLLLQRMFKAGAWRCVLLMIAANYLSMGFGLWLVSGPLPFAAEHLLVGPPLMYAGRTLLAIAVFVFLASLLIEWPAVILLLRDQPRRVMRSCVGVITVNAVSYAVLTPLYLNAGSISALTLVRRENPPTFVPPDLCGWVYYVTRDDTAIRRVRFDGANDEYVALFPRPHYGGWIKGRVFAAPHPDDDCFDLVLPPRRYDEEPYLVVSEFSRRAGVFWSTMSGEPELIWNRFGRAADLRAESQRDFECYTGFWAIDGVSIHGPSIDLNLALATPSIAWAAGQATVVPNGMVVLELGEQIVILDPKNKRMGFLAIGRSPVVAIEDE